MAVTKEGIPIRIWSWPGSTGESPLLRQVRDDLQGWQLGRVLALALFDHGAAELRESDVPVRERSAASQGWRGPEGKLPVPGAILGG